MCLLVRLDKTRHSAWTFALLSHRIARSQSGWGCQAPLESIRANPSAQYSASESRLLKAMSDQVLNISKDWYSATSLGKPVPLPHHSHSKKVFSYAYMQFSVFQFVLIGACPGTGHYWEESGFIFFPPLIRSIYTWIRASWAFSHPGWTVPALPVPPHIKNAPVP